MIKLLHTIVAEAAVARSRRAIEVAEWAELHRCSVSFLMLISERRKRVGRHVWGSWQNARVSQCRSEEEEE